jgi:hypothetical protein
MARPPSVAASNSIKLSTVLDIPRGDRSRQKTDDSGTSNTWSEDSRCLLARILPKAQRIARTNDEGGL